MATRAGAAAPPAPPPSARQRSAPVPVPSAAHHFWVVHLPSIVRHVGVTNKEKQSVGISGLVRPDPLAVRTSAKSVVGHTSWLVANKNIVPPVRRRQSEKTITPQVAGGTPRTQPQIGAKPSGRPQRRQSLVQFAVSHLSHTTQASHAPRRAEQNTLNWPTKDLRRRTKKSATLTTGNAPRPKRPP